MQTLKNKDKIWVASLVEATMQLPRREKLFQLCVFGKKSSNIAFAKVG